MERCFRVGFMACIGLFALPSFAGISFDTIPCWIGDPATSQHRAALVVDWNDSPEDALLWGYAWDGTATGRDMFQAVAQVDPRLSSAITDFGWGLQVDRIAMDQDLDGGYAEPGDHDRDNSIFGSWWSYWGTEESPAPVWVQHAVGMTDRILENRDVDGWSWDADWNTAAPEPSSSPLAATAIPEPSTLVCMILAGLVFHQRLRSH